MEGPRIVLPTGSLTHRFFGVRKVDPPKLALATGIGRFRDPFFGRKKLHFWKKSAKSGNGTFTFGKGCKNHNLLNWRWWRHEEKDAQKGLFWCNSEGIRENIDWNESPLDTGLEWIQTDTICLTDPCFAPLPCTVYLVLRGSRRRTFQILHSRK